LGLLLEPQKRKLDKFRVGDVFLLETPFYLCLLSKAYLLEVSCKVRISFGFATPTPEQIKKNL
jgi:hypothetical protein